jgi:hypothetical protein
MPQASTATASPEIASVDDFAITRSALNRQGLFFLRLSDFLELLDEFVGPRRRPPRLDRGVPGHAGPGRPIEHGGIIGMPEYRSPLGGFGPPDPEMTEMLARPGLPSDEELERYAASRGRGYWSCNLQFYGGPGVIAAHLAYAKEKLGAAIPGATFEDGELWTFPLTEAQLDRAHKVAVGQICETSRVRHLLRHGTVSPFRPYQPAPGRRPARGRARIP